MPVWVLAGQVDQSLHVCPHAAHLGDAGERGLEVIELSQILNPKPYTLNLGDAGERGLEVNELS